MEGTAPVFKDREGFRQWKRLHYAERAYVRGKDRKGIRLEQTIKDILRRDGRIDPRVICRIIDVSEKHGIGDVQKTVLKLMERCDLSDSSPQLKASKTLFRLGSYDLSASILDRMTLKSDLTSWEYIRGRICQEMGDDDSAYAHFVQCNLNDDTFLPVYDRLHRLREDEGWDCRKKIAELYLGRNVPADDTAPSNPLEDLVSYYRQWMNDDRTVLQTILSSQMYADGDRDYVLAAARFESETEDYRSSMLDYQKISDGSYSVSLESARVLMKAGEYMMAQTVCRTLSMSNTGDRRLNELLIDMYTQMADRAGLLSSMEKFLSYDYADADAYTLTAESLMKLSLNADASIIIDEMIDSGIEEAFYLSAKNDHMVGRDSHAIRSINRALKIHADNTTYRILKIRILLSLGRVPKAMGNLEFVLSEHSDLLEALQIKRNLLTDKGDLEGAYDICTRMQEQIPNDPDLLEYMAMLLERMGRPDSALKLYRDAIGMRNDPELFMQVVTSLVKDAKYEDAISVVNEYDDTYGDIQGAWILKGNAEYAIGRYPDACDSFDRALSIDHSNPSIWHSKGLAAEAMGDLESAEAAYDRAVLLDLENPDYWISRSVVEEKTGDLAAAVDSLNHVISDSPDNTYALIRKSHILVKMGRVSDALVFADLASKIEPENYGIMRIRRDIYERIPDYRNARIIASEMVRMRPEDTQERLAYAKMCIADKDFDEALDTLSHGPGDDIDVLRMMSHVYRLTGDHQGTVDTCSRILEIDPDDDDAMMVMADAYTKLGDNENASRLYDRLNSIRPDDTELQVKQAMVDSEVDREILLDTLKRNISDDPEDVKSILDLVDLLCGLERYDEAEVYADMAISAAPSSSQPYLKKAELKMVLGLYQDALDVLDDAKSSAIIQDARIWERIGDADTALGFTDEALLAYNSAMKMDDSIPGLHTKIGEIQERNGSLEAAMNSYMSAYEMDSRDIKAMYRMARMLFNEGKVRTAGKYVDEILDIDETYGPALLLKAKILADSEDTEGIRTILEKAVENDVDKEYTDEMEFILSESEVGAAEDEDDIRPTVVDLLMYSYDNGIPPDDPEALEQAGVKDEDVGKVMVYLSDIDICRDIIPRGEWFERMETLSNKAIIASGMDVEKERMMPLQNAMFDSGTDDIDEAKKLVSYIYASLTLDIDPFEFDQKITDTIRSLSSEETVPSMNDIMARFGLGVYSARTVKLLLEENASVIDHV